MFRKAVKQFCLNTGLHGYRFIFLPRRLLLERVFWMVAVFLFLITAIVLLIFTWFNINKNPTLLVTDSTHHPIWNYNFPAVTICSYNLISKKQAKNLAEILKRKNPDLSIEQLMKKIKLSASLIFDTHFESVFKINETQLLNIFDHSNMGVQEMLYQLAPTCKDIIKRCRWKGDEKRCDSLFERILTSEGVCCSFNYYGLKNHSFGGVMGYKRPKTPYRVSACGYFSGLEIILYSNADDYFITKIPAIGHNVLVHNPYVHPGSNSQRILTENLINYLIGVTPTITYSTKPVYSLSQDQRRCFFEKERILLNFPLYKYKNCIAECKMNITRKYCGCIQFYYHNPDGDYPETRICDLRDLPCLRANKGILRSSLPGATYSFKMLGLDGFEPVKNECKCLPECNPIAYSAVASSAILSRQFSTNMRDFYGDINITNHSVVRVFFNDLVSIKNRRDLTTSWNAVLGTFGGLLGLFLGFNFVSGMEILYIFTIRLIIDLIHKKNKEPLRVDGQRRVENQSNDKYLRQHSVFQRGPKIFLK